MHQRGASESPHKPETLLLRLRALMCFSAGRSVTAMRQTSDWPVIQTWTSFRGAHQWCKCAPFQKSSDSSPCYAPVQPLPVFYVPVHAPQ